MTFPGKEIREKTEVLVRVEEIIKRTLQEFSRIRKTYDNCTDLTYPSVLVTTEPIRNAYKELKDRGVKVRFITEITSDNIKYVKEIFEIINDIRHLDGVKGNLETELPTQLLQRFRQNNQ